MKLYFSPLASSMATRIAAYEIGADLTFVHVDPHTKLTSEGDFHTVHSLGLVPALELDDGTLLVENVAILQFVADLHPDAGLAPRDPLGRAQLQMWLSFIGTELHKAVFAPLFDENAPAEAKQYALSKADARLDWLAARLEGREYVLDRFTVADAYLFAVLNSAQATPIELARWPRLRTYLRALRERPSIARALAEEYQVYLRDQERATAR